MTDQVHTQQQSHAALQPLSFALSLALSLALKQLARRGSKPPALTPPVETAAPSVALVKGRRSAFELIGKYPLSHDTVLLRFALPTEDHILGLPAGQHLFCYGTVKGETLVRAYSTITRPDTKGYFEIPLKVYFPDEKHPEGGKMSQYLYGLEIGSTVEFKGPVGRFVYEGMGRYLKNRKIGRASKISMIAGGTGINPFVQIVRKVLEDPLDATQISLIYANKTEEDILFRRDLDRLASKHWNFNIFHTVEQASWHWIHGRGRVTQKMLERHLYQPNEDSILLLCGPGPMTDALSDICIGKLGWSKDRISVF